MEEYVESNSIQSDELVSIIGSLIDVMKREEVLLSSHSAQDLSSLIHIKQSLTQRYCYLVSQLDLKSSNVTCDEVLTQALLDLRNVSSRNEIFLRSTLETTSIYIDEALKTALKSRVQTYDARGRLPSVRNNGSAVSIPMTGTHQL